MADPYRSRCANSGVLMTRGSRPDSAWACDDNDYCEVDECTGDECLCPEPIDPGGARA